MADNNVTILREENTGQNIHPVSGYQLLANAIIERAAEDYRRALVSNNELTIKEVSRFFNSQWFTALTDIDGSWMLKKLNSRGKSKSKKDSKSARIVTYKGIEYPSLLDMCKAIECSYNVVYKYTKNNRMGLESAVELAKKVKKEDRTVRYKGVTYKNTVEACKELGITYATTIAYIRNHKASFEEAVEHCKEIMAKRELKQKGDNNEYREKCKNHQQHQHGRVQQGVRSNKKA